MATESTRDFFTDRISQELARNIDLGLSPGYDAMQGALDDKISKLQQLKQLRIKEQQVQAASLASQWNLDPNGVLGSAVNIGQSVYEGGASAARSLSAAGNTYLGNLKSVDATAADQKAASEQNTLAKQRLLQEIQARKAADADPGLVSAVQNTASAMYDNPQGSAEFIAEQLPNSAVALGSGVAGAKVGAAGGAAIGSIVPVVGTAAGAAVGGTLGFLGGMFLGNSLLETGGKAIEKAQDGGMTEAKRQEAINEGLIKGGVITAVDAATLGLGGKVAKTFNKAAIDAGARAEARVLANAGVDISNLKAIEAALSDPILRASAKAAGNAAAKQTSGIGSKAATAVTGLTMETVGEGTGEYLGELAATGKADVYDAVLEAAAGFTQSVPETAFAMKQATGNDLNAKGISQADLTIPDPVKETPVSNPKAKEVTAAAIKTGDVSALLDEKSPTYAPEKAISALAGHSALETTDEATKTANLEKAQKIVSDLEDQKMSNEIALRMVTPEGIQKLQTQLEEARVAGNTDAVASLEAALVDAKDDPKAAARINNQIATLNDRINQAKTNLDDFVQESQNKTLDLEVEATKITADDLAGSQTTADRIINLSMATPERLSQATAEKLASDTSLSEQQRQYFRKFSEARQAEAAMMGLDDVNKQIYLGGNGNEGIQTYRRDIGAALAGNDKKGALGKLKQLAGFVQDQTNKAAKTKEAYDKFFETGKEYVVRSDGNRGWFIQEGQLAENERRAEGAVNINARSKKLVNAVQVSSKALNTAQDELRAAYTNKFSTKPPQEKANVDETAETKQAETQGSESTQPSAATGTGTEANAISTKAEGSVSISESQTFGYAARTRRNAQAGDITIVFALDTTTAGEKLTAKAVREAGKQLIKWVPGMKTSEFADQIVAALKAVNGSSINVAGNGIYSWGETTQAQLNERMFKVLGKVKAAYPELTTIISGGQTGTDMAGVIAGRALGLNIDVHFPPGFVQRGADRKDSRNTEASVAKQIEDGVAALLEPQAEAAATSQADSESAAKATTAAVPETQTQSVEESADSTTTVVEAEQQTTLQESTEGTAAKSGLTVLQGKTSDEELPPGTKLGQVYQTINQVVAFLSQKKTPVDKATDISKDRPLVSLQNFMSQWAAGDTVPSELFADELTDSEIGALNNFRKMYDLWAPMVRANLKKGALPNLKGVATRDDFLFKDPIQGFFNKDGSVDENVVTAIVYGAYSWLVDSMNAPALKESDDILEMHGVKGTDVYVSPEGMTALNRMAVFKDAALTSLGRYTVDALGLIANKKADSTYMAKLTAAFGLHSLVLLVNDTNLVDAVTIDGEQLNEYLPGIDMQPTGTTAKGKAVYPKLTYLSVNRDSKLVLPDISRAIKDASVQSMGVIQRVFSTEYSPNYATWKPVKFSQQRAKKTGQKISKRQRKILEKAQKVENRIIPSMWNALTVLGDSVVLKAAGWTASEEARIHIENRESALAKNLGLEDQLAGMKALVQNAIDSSPLGIAQPFFAQFEVWRNFRVGVTTRDMNLQSSKIHRFMFFRPEWQTTIKRDDEATREQFLVAVAQALGIKVDQQPNNLTIDKLNGMEQSVRDMAMNLAKAVSAPDQQLLSEADKQNIGTFVANAEGMQSLQALLAYGKFLLSEQAGDPEVTVEMLVGVDGKTNGPILTHLALGAAENADGLFKQINRGGMYRDADQVKNYNHWYQALTSLDLYEDLAFNILNGIQATSQLAAISVFTKSMIENGKVTSAGRNLAKTPLTSFVFGSSIDKSIQNMQESFIQSVFDRIQAVADGTDKRTTTADLITGLNTLLGSKMPSNTSIEQLMEKQFSKGERIKLAQAFYETIGVRVEETMKGYFGSFISRRNDVNKMIQGSFAFYNIIYQDLRAKELERLMDSGDIKFTQTKDGRIPLHDMKAEQEQALREKVAEVLPLAHTAYTQGTDELDAGLYMAKTRKAVSSAPLNQVQVQLNKLIQSGENWRVPYITGFASETVESSPGVAGLPYFMHSLDSFIMHDSIEDTETLNVHDEAGNGVGNIVKTAQAINRSTWKGMLNFSPATEAYDMLGRSVLAMVKLAQSGTMTPEAMAMLVQNMRLQLPKKIRNDIPVTQLVQQVLAQAFEAQFVANKVRLESMAQMTALDQYTWEGGQYDVSPDDRLEAQGMLQKHLQQAQVSAELMAAAETLGKAFAANNVPTQTVVETVAEPEADSTEQVFGPKGKSRITSDPNLVVFFSRNPKATAGQVIKVLMAQGNLSPINRKILQLVSRVVDSALPIEYVTSKTDPDSVLEAPQSPSRGWYVAKGTKEAIYVLSPDFVASGLTAETLLHELVHAAIAMTIDSPSAAAKELVAELEALRVLAKEYAEANGLTQFGSALKNVQEFVAWGMSNMPFQRDVLNKIQMQSKTKGNALVTGMQKFISTMAQLLFRKPDENIDNGLTVLISNVSGLANAAAQERKQGANLNLSQENTEAVDRYSTQDIYDALDTGAVSPAFSDHLKSMLNGIVESLHGPFGTFKEAMRKDEAKDPMDAWLKAVASGKAPFASAIITSNFAGSSQEHFVMEQVEATVKAALERNEASTTLLYRELYKLYNEALAKLKPSDFESQEDYDFVFDVQSDKDGRSDYLARFAALGLASEKFNKLLRFDTEVDLRALGEGNSLFERLVNVYEKILAFFAQKLTHVYGGQQADAKLESLVSQLVDIEAKKRAALTAPKGWAGDAIDMIEGRFKEVSDVAREKVAKALASDMVKNNSNAVVRATGTVLRTMAMGQSDAVMHNLRKLRDTVYKDKDDILVGILNDVKGPLAQFNALLRGVKHHEQQRKQLITKHASVTMKMFKNAGKNLSKLQRKSITTVLMRSGAHKLDGFFTLPELEKMIRLPGQLEQGIAKLEAQLGSAIKTQHLYQAETLGIYKATGQNVSKALMMNAHVITRMLGTQYSGRITEAEAQKEEPIVSALVALYAIRRSNMEFRVATADALATENSRTDGNGVSFLLNMHKEMEQDSLERLFKGNPILMEHGYVPDVVNPHTKVVAANAADGVDLVAQGYKKGAKVYTDPVLPGGEPRQLYVQRDGGLAPWLSGIFSLTSMKAKGTAISDGFMNVNTVAGLENAQLHATVTNAKLAQLQVVSGSNQDLMQAKKSQLAPVYNEKGEIVQWRYLMESATKDNLLERENRFDLLMGVLAGSVFDKVNSREWNATAVTALRQQYELEGNINSEMYVEIGAKSSDPEMRELWAMLPDATKRTIRTVWGRDGLKIRRDSMDIFFGYRKLSAADFLRKERAALDGVQKIMREFFHLYAKTRGMPDHDADNYAKRIGVALAKGERGWQEVVREVKDIIVVKTGVVLAGNMYSNDSMLYAKGVKNRWHHQLVAFRGISAYQADSDRLFELENQLEFGQTNGQEKQMRLEVARLKDAIAKNPVKPLIDAGLLPTIAEDVEEEDPYSYKTYWARKAEGVVNRIPEGVRTIGKVVYMTHDTPIYRFLSKTTQYSDFVARYALYQHLISREENPLSHEDAIQKASDTFVNYDIPMNRKLQYSDDMGFTPFIKYFFRIQRVIMDTFRENPARVLSLLLMQQFIDLGPIFLESSWLAHVGNNPVRSGAFQIVDAVTELPVINGAAGLLK